VLQDDKDELENAWFFVFNKKKPPLSASALMALSASWAH
jgi:hypothetical protein